MASWKKIVTSGSNISQLNNDSGYLTSATLTQANTFATASYSGTNLLADSPSGSLNFASSSGQGLTISANSGTDTLTWGLSSVPNSSLANSSITIGSTAISLGASSTTLAGLTSVTSTTFVGNLTGTATTASNITPAITNGTDNRVLTDNGNGTINGEANLTFDGSTLTVAGTIAANGASGITTSQTTFPLVNATATTINFGGAATAINIGASTGTTTVNNNLSVLGTLYVQGSVTAISSSNLYVADQFILVASGAASNGDGGIVVDRGSDVSGNIAFGYDSTTRRWGYQDGVVDTTNAIDPTSNSGVSGSFAGIVFTEGSHGATKPVTGEFAVAGAIYTNTDGTIWIYS